jgi:serine phosphatase RsbU (regulator of sigma subunit)
MFSSLRRTIAGLGSYPQDRRSFVMLDLQDFFHLPEVDGYLEQLAADGPGLVIVAGLASPVAPEHPADGDGFLPSGRAAIFRILTRHLLARHPEARAIVVSETRDMMRAPRQLKHQVEWLRVEPPHTYSSRITYATFRQPDLLVIDRLNAETAPLALQAAQFGLHVLAQLDTIFSGAGVARQLLDWGVPRESLAALTWIITVQRLTTLCLKCKVPAPLDAARLDDLRCRYPAVQLSELFFQAAGCDACHHTGRQGNVSAFDVFHTTDPATLFSQASQLPLQEYLLRLAALGHLALQDALSFEADQLRRTYALLAGSEHALAEANATLERKLAQLEAANKVLQQRTEALVSLQDIGHTLVTSSLDDLAQRVCRHARNLCGADRAILYFLRADGAAEMLAVSGWDAGLLHQRVDATLVMGAGGPSSAGSEPTPFAGYPPGAASEPGRKDVALKAGLRVPLLTQQEIVGLMIVHSTAKPAFAPGEVALLQAFANQAALAIQRTGLIQSLSDKVAQLEAAQVELVQKERLESELELARQVQQKLLPRTFPLLPGLRFAARCEPARRVGGDLYDVILLDADRVGVVIADVSDKGMPAALFMALTRSLLLAEARRERSPRAVLTNVHRLLRELGEPEMFVTVFYGVVDVASRQLTYTRAGHDRPLIVRGDTVEALRGEGAFLGYLDPDQLKLSEECIDLRSGDRLVLYTDGLVDAVAQDYQPFGASRLAALLQSCATLEAPDLVAAVFERIAAYQGTADQYDDMTMLVVEFAN